ncbi:MAG: undecaprenyl-diphosphate phosphatase [Cyanobacteria bacterium]|nr:undecaprenyl-diphosphate phosphatase [Cyanobacteria bacterium GSL.Bin1]
MFPSASAQTATVTEETTMNAFQAVVLGIVQGITEFLPISSSAHLKVVPVALGWGDPGITFSAVIHLGSIAAIIWYFRQDLTQLLRGSAKGIREQDYYNSDLRLTAAILLGTLPILVCGIFWKLLVNDESPIRSMMTIAITSIGIGLLLGLGDWVGKRDRAEKDLKPQDAILMGIAQALALIPGTSRSGITITAGLFMGLDRPTAARFALLMGIPTILLAGSVELVDVLEQGWNDAETLPILIGTVTTFIFSYLSVVGLIRYLQQQNTWVFVGYRLIFGCLILWGVMANRF